MVLGFSKAAAKFVLGIAVDQYLANRELEKFRKQSEETKEEISELRKELQGLNESNDSGFKGLQAGVNKTNETLQKFGDTIKKVVIGYIGYQGVDALMDFMDVTTSLRNRLVASNLALSEQTDVTNRLFRISRETGAQVQDLAGTFGRFQIALSETNATSTEITDAIEGLAKNCRLVRGDLCRNVGCITAD